jgi:hypothetical protein
MPATGDWSFYGELYSYVHMGKIQAFNYKDSMFRLVLASMKGEASSLYLINEDRQEYGNYLLKELLPMLLKGETEAAEVTDPQYVGGNPETLTITNGEFFSVGAAKMSYDDLVSGVYSMSIYVKVKFLSFQSAAGYGDFLTMMSNKKFVLKISDQGYMRLVGAAGETLDYSTQLLINTWYHLVVTIGRASSLAGDLQSYWMIELQGDGKLAEGGSFNCKSKELIFRG